jgi:mono/diheme cytochrome c family protein
LLKQCLKAKDHKVRAAAVNVLHYTGHQIAKQTDLLKELADDPSGRVQLEVISAASWLKKEDGLKVLAAIKDAAIANSKATFEKELNGKILESKGNYYSIKAPLTKSPITSIQFKHTGQIKLAEIEVFANGINISQSAKASISSMLKGNQKFNADMKINQLNDGKHQWNNFVLTEGKGEQWVKLEFSTPVQAEEVKIWIGHTFDKKMENANLIISNGSKVIYDVKVKHNADDGKVKIDYGMGGSYDGRRKQWNLGEYFDKMDPWVKQSYATALTNLQGRQVEAKAEEIITHLTGSDRQAYVKGKQFYSREGYCITCHSENGLGVAMAGFPPLAGAKWVTGSEERLIKIALKGLMGPIEVKGKKYPGAVPMTAFGKMLNDRDLAAVLTYVRNSFGNKASVIKAGTVKKIRALVKNKPDFLNPAELLKEHPHK